MMTATRPRRHGKCAFLLMAAATACAGAAEPPDPGWRLTVIPSFEQRPALHEKIPGSRTAVLAVARPAGYGEFEYATTRGALRFCRELAAKHGPAWLDRASTSIRRDKNRVIERILITGEDPMLPSLVTTPAFYRRFEPLLGDGFHVIIPDRGTIALYPRLAGEIPPADVAALIEINRLATYPVSTEVFRATRDGLVAEGALVQE
jgi:hypothetical protein